LLRNTAKDTDTRRVAKSLLLCLLRKNSREGENEAALHR
jgi:hypothetical protein